MKVFAALFLLSFAAFAQTAVPGQVAVISMQPAMLGTKDGQKASAQLEAKIQPRQKDFDQRQREIAQSQDQLEKGGTVLNPEKRNGIIEDLEKRKRKLERDISDAKEELNAEQQTLFQSLGQKIGALVDEYAKDNGFSIVLDVSNPNSQVLYASPASNITQDIIAQYDKTTP